MASHPVWGYDEVQEQYYKIFTLDELPEDTRNLFIRAIFTTPKGLRLRGYLVGIIRVYCIAFFYLGEKYFFNKNLPEECIEDAKHLVTLLQSSKVHDWRKLFPVRYETDIDLEGFGGVQGEFDAFEHVEDILGSGWRKN